jgi:hypothetical protein
MADELYDGRSVHVDVYTGSTTDEVPAFWASFTADSSKSPVGSAGLMWPKYTGGNSSIVVFGDAVGSQLQPATVLNDIVDFNSC